MRARWLRFGHLWFSGLSPPPPPYAYMHICTYAHMHISGNGILGKFGMSLDNFKADKDPSTGSYNISFQQ